MPREVHPEELQRAISKRLEAFGWRTKSSDALDCAIWPTPTTVRVFLNFKQSVVKNNHTAIGLEMEALTYESVVGGVRWKSVWSWFDVRLTDSENISEAQENLALDGIEELLARYRAANP